MTKQRDFLTQIGITKKIEKKWQDVSLGYYHLYY